MNTPWSLIFRTLDGLSAILFLMMCVVFYAIHAYYFLTQRDPDFEFSISNIFFQLSPRSSKSTISPEKGNRFKLLESSSSILTPTNTTTTSPEINTSLTVPPSSPCTNISSVISGTPSINSAEQESIYTPTITCTDNEETESERKPLRGRYIKKPYVDVTSEGEQSPPNTYWSETHHDDYWTDGNESTLGFNPIY